MKVELIGIYDEKIDLSGESSIYTEYYLNQTMVKEDFDNGTVDGYEGFFTTQEDTNSFIIKGEDHDLPDDDFSRDNLTKEEIEFMDSLEEGDVIVFEADLDIECHYGEYLISPMADITNIRKYEDKYAADEIRYIVSQMPTGYEEA